MGWAAAAAVFFVLLMATARPAAAQSGAVSLLPAPGGLGLDGTVRPGAWAGLRVVVDHPGPETREVELRWELRDADGDAQVSGRRVTLAAERNRQSFWLYAALPADLTADDRFTVRAVDTATGLTLTEHVFGPDPGRIVHPDDAVWLVSSGADLGLSDYARHEAAHARVHLVRGPGLDALPDRWMGLQTLSTLVWTPDRGGDPTDPRVAGEGTLEAVREWVARGGHLVIVLPVVNNPWFGSPLADLLPVNAAAARTLDTERWAEPAWMGTLRPVDPPPLTVTRFDVPPGGRATPLLRDADGDAAAVTARFGFGRVTLIGTDLTQPAVRDAGLPAGEGRLWQRVFNRTAPVYSDAWSKARLQARELRPAGDMRASELGDFVGRRTALTGSPAAALTIAVAAAALYWLAAAVVLPLVLRPRRVQNRADDASPTASDGGGAPPPRPGWRRAGAAWPLFAGTVVVASMMAWSGAMLLRPQSVQLRHVSVLDVDANAAVSRVRSFVSVFLPGFAAAQLDLAAPRVPGLPAPPNNLLAAVGVTDSTAGAGYIETRRYRRDATDPGRVNLPARATTRRLTLDALVPTGVNLPGLRRPFEAVARVPLTAGDDGWPRGELVHTLPGPLTNVLIVQCRGTGYDVRGRRQDLPPRVWRLRDTAGGDTDRWEPGVPLALRSPPRAWNALAVPGLAYGKEREPAAEGYLGELRAQASVFRSATAAGGPDASVLARRMNLMTFYDALPPPNVRDLANHDVRLSRGVVGPSVDLTPLLTGRRLIVLGQLESGPLPAPLTVNGEAVPGDGWTAVRLIYDY